MTSENSPFRFTPRSIREQTFRMRRRGLDEHEVDAYLSALAADVEQSERHASALRAENDQLRAQVAEQRGKGQEGISEQSVVLFSQAQQVADSLIDEAVQHARDLMASARAQQRDIMSQAHAAAEAAVAHTGSFGSDDPGVGYHTPIAEVEYARTFAQVAQVQLRAVVQALNDQVDKLGDVPRLGDDEGPRRPSVPSAVPDPWKQTRDASGL